MNGEGSKESAQGEQWGGAGRSKSKVECHSHGAKTTQHDDTNSRSNRIGKQSRNVRVRRGRSTEQWLLWCNERGDFAMARND